MKIEFDGETITFPTTVEEAVRRHQLSFSAPGYYYRQDDSKEMVINIPYQASDYRDEHQAKEVLYDRNVVSYVFKYKGDRVPFESLQRQVESLCRCKLTFVTDSLSPEKDPGFQTFPAEIKQRLPQKGLHYYATAPLSKDVTIGFRRRPSWRGEDIPEVDFFYRQSPAEIRQRMMQN